MTVMLANAGAMPARSPCFNNTLESFRKLKSAFATPLRHSWRIGSQPKTPFSGNGVPVTPRIADALRFGGNGGEEKVRRLHAPSSFGYEGEEQAEIRSKHFDAKFPRPELKSSSTRPRPGNADFESSRRMKWTPSADTNCNRQNFSGSRAAFGPNSVARKNGGRDGGLGNESRSRGRLGFRGNAENEFVEEQRRAAFENWAREKFREVGTPALSAIEEMRQTFAPGSARLGPRLVSSAVRTERMTSSVIGGGYGSSRVQQRRGSSSFPTSRFGVLWSDQQLVARSSIRSESWSPKSTAISRGSRSTSNVASRTGVQFPAEESGRKSWGEGTSASRLDARSLPQPLLVKRRMKFPINFYGHAGTVMLVDKPQGWTSFAVCAKLRHLLKIQKVGHAGTLDPLATGLLIVCLGKATKLADSYQAMTKVYSGTLRLGELTPSLDADTEVSDVLPWEHITDDQLEQAKQEFVGDIFQTPPMYSAIKVDGERLYVKARKGEQIDIPARLVTVIDFQLERSSENRQDILFRVTCSKGTYIRSLCADLARAVGSYAHLTALRREKIGTYSVKDAWPILEFVEQYSQAKDNVSIRAET